MTSAITVTIVPFETAGFVHWRFIFLESEAKFTDQRSGDIKMTQSGLRGHRSAMKVRSSFAVTTSYQRIRHRIKARRNSVICSNGFGISNLFWDPTKMFAEETDGDGFVVNKDGHVAIAGEGAKDVLFVRCGKTNRIMEDPVLHTEGEEVAYLFPGFTADRILMENYGDAFRGTEVAGKFLDRRIIGQGLVTVAS